MRVLYLTDSLSDLDGVGRYAVRLITALQELDPELEVEVLLARKHRPTSAAVPARWKVGVGLPPDYFFYMSGVRFWADSVRCLPRVRRAARQADLVHAIKDYPHNFLGLVAARAAGRPCIATGHGTYTIQPLLDRRHRRKALWAYANFARLIAVSRFTARRLLSELAGRPPSAERIAVIPNAVSAEHYAARRELGPRPWHGLTFTLSIGELKERKGHHLALSAWCEVAHRHPDLHHFLIGRGAGDAYERSLHDLVREAGVEGRVHFLGNVTEDEKIDLLQRAQAFLHTPVTAADGGFEGFGIVYLEAAASGTASIGTTECGAEDAIVDGETGFLVPQEKGSVEEALERLIGDGELRRRMGLRAVEHARASSWEDNARRVLELYRQVLAEGRRA